MWKKHPKALPFLFFSEMWERFGYYLMIGIFTLYLKDVRTGYGMTEAESADVYGTFIALVFLTPFVGGLIADRYWGYRKSIIIGGLLMSVGYCLMAVHNITMLYLSMTLVIAGNGFFKPNISTLLGNVYSTPQHRAQKDEGYNIFYMGINVGAFICNFFGAALYVMLGWSYAFIAAGIGMLLGVFIFLSGVQHYHGYDVKKGVQPGDMSFTKICLLIFLPSVISGAFGWILPGQLLGKSLFGSASTDAFIFACIPVIWFYISLYRKSATQEKKPVLALLSIFAVVILFWAVFKQNGSALNTWADRYTDRQVTGTTEDVFTTLKFSQPVSYKKDSVPLYDEQFRLQKKEGAVIKVYDYPAYFKNIPPEKRPAENSSINVWATNLSQSINPGWVIFFTPLIVAFFTWLRHKNREPSTATKIAMGLFISALSALVMTGAVYAGGNGAEKSGVWWLFASYGVITIGELFLSPMGLSIVSKLSPPRITALMMGGWFVATSIGNKLSGVLATMWDTYDHKANYFLLNFVLLLVAAVACFVMLRWLNRILKEKGVN